MEYAVIMAGGSGKRLWPLSRENRPKQVLELLDGQTLLRKCFERLEGIFDREEIFVLTNTNYIETVRQNLSELPKGNIIAEPAMRDTAAAIGLAASILHKYDADANMAVVTADQLLEPTEVFQGAIKTAVSFIKANPKALLTFGIQPTFPSTQLGYIKFGTRVSADESQNAVQRIDAFREKPDETTAQAYLKTGEYFWNSGLFVWRCETILTYLKKFVPESIKPLEKIRDSWGSAGQGQALKEWFPKLPKISIDYAVMEKAEEVYGIKLNCRWLDLGSFAALRGIVEPDSNGNVVASEYWHLLDSRNNIVVTEAKNHLIALIGVENMVVSHSPDATLVCPVDQVDRLKELLERIKICDGAKFL